MKNLLIGVGIIIAILLGVYFINDRSAFNAWQAERDDWHRRCDRFRETPLTNPVAKACNEELQLLTAKAKRNGWIN